MELSVIVVLYNSAETIAPCVASVPTEAELVLIDNGSSDNGLEVALGVRADAVAARTHNRGFGAGCNRGALASSKSTLLFLNPDAVLDAGAAELLTEVVGGNRDLVAGPAIVDSDGNLISACRKATTPSVDLAELVPGLRRVFPTRWRRDLPPEDSIYETGGNLPYLQGACIAISRKLFIRIGGFDESFFLYHEEEDLCRRVRDEGGLCVYLPEVSVRHVWGHSTGQQSGITSYELFRSRVLFYKKWSGPATGVVMAFAMGLLAILGFIVSLARSVVAAPNNAQSARTGRAACWDTFRGCVDGMLSRPSANSQVTQS